MALWFDLNINSQFLGLVEIVRQEELDLTNQAAILDTVNTYDVYLDTVHYGPVRHRYGDGAWRLVAIATDAIANKVSK